MEGFDHKVANIDSHEWGRKEIRLAEVEMPGIILSLLTKNRLNGCKN